jgi:hypothetical protein
MMQHGQTEQRPFFQSCMKDGAQNGWRRGLNGKDGYESIIEMQDDTSIVRIDSDEWTTFTERPQDIPIFSQGPTRVGLNAMG